MSLDQFDKEYNPSDAGKPLTLESLEDGVYVLTVQSAALVKTERTGEDILRWMYRVVQGPSMVGSVVESVNFFRSQVSVNILGADLALLGLPTSTWTVGNGKPFSKMMRESLPGLAGITFSAAKVTTDKGNGKVYHNLRIKTRVSGASPMPEQPIENDLPF